jgi:hypothetical protein
VMGSFSTTRTVAEASIFWGIAHCLGDLPIFCRLG